MKSNSNKTIFLTIIAMMLPSMYILNLLLEGTLGDSYIYAYVRQCSQNKQITQDKGSQTSNFLMYVCENVPF